MRSLRRCDARLYAAIGALPASPADRWLRRLSTAADHSILWFVVGALMATRSGGSGAGRSAAPGRSSSPARW